MDLFGFELRREMVVRNNAWGRDIKLWSHTFIISWGEGEDGRFGGGVTISDG